MIHSIDEIDVSKTWWAKHQPIPGGKSESGMGSLVIKADIGLRLYNYAGEEPIFSPMDQMLTQDFPGNDQGGGRIEVPIELFHKKRWSAVYPTTIG